MSSNFSNNANNLVFFKKTDDRAVTPFKNFESVGYDLTAISLHSKFSDNTYLFDTGIQVKPADGYYVEILPRSSLSKTGYMLANSVGVIDPDYRGNLMIALRKVDLTAPDLELPFTRCQLVLRKFENFNMVDVTERVNENPDFFYGTERGAGGFGSTDAKN